MGYGYSQAEGPRAPEQLQLTSETVQVGLTVGDLDGSLSFYRNLMDFEVLAEAEVAGRGSVTQVGRGNVRLNLLSVPNGDLAPNHPGGVGPGPEGGWMPGGQYGIRWFTFKVQDLDTVLERADRFGYEVAVPLVQATHNSRFAILRDPDGNSVEFVEYVDITLYEQKGQDQ